MAIVGMDLEEVRKLSRDLQSQADSLGVRITSLDGLVHSIPSMWHGPDSVQFIDWWTNQHRPALLQAADAILGLSKSALHNVNDQVAASGGGAGSAPGSGTSAGPGASATVPAASGSPSKPPLFVPPTWTDDATTDFFRQGTTLGANLGLSGQYGYQTNADGTFSFGGQDGQWEADAFGGVKGSAELSGELGPGGAKVHVNGDLFAGADASAKGSFGGPAAEVGAGIHGYAGAGVRLKGDGEFSYDKVKISLGLGAAVGLGAGVDLSVSVSPKEVVSSVGGFFDRIF